MKHASSFFFMSLELVLVIGLVVVLIVTIRSVSGGAPNSNKPTMKSDPFSKPLASEGDTTMASVDVERATAEAFWQNSTPLPPPTPIYYPVKTIDDIPLVVLNNPDFQNDANDPDFGPCVRAANPGKALFVKSLDKALADYYVVPFYRETELCGVAFVGIENGKGTLGGWSSAGGTPYPPVSASEAKFLVEKAGYKVLGEPQLSFQWLQEGTSEFWPFWAVGTADNQTVYVVYTRGVVEVWNAKDVHPIN